MRPYHLTFYKLFLMKVLLKVNRYFYPGLISLFLLLPSEAQAVIDWHLEWHKGDISAQLFVFNPEYQEQSFVLETGDRIRLDNIETLDLALNEVILDDVVRGFDLIIGEDIRFKLPPRARRAKVPVIVYVVDTAILGDLAFDSQFQDGFSLRDISPVPRDSKVPKAPVLIYRKVVDHEYDAEQLVRCGQKLDSTYQDVQDVLLFLFQRVTELTPGAQPIWETCFPELISAVPTPLDSCLEFVTVDPFSITGRVIRIGDILEARDPRFGRVVAGEDIQVLSGIQSVQVFRLSGSRPPLTQDTAAVYVGPVSHDPGMEQVIRCGQQEGFGPEAICNVLANIRDGTPLQGDGLVLKQILDRGCPLAPPPTVSNGGICGPFFSSSTAASTGANLIFLAGVLLPLRALMKRRIKKSVE